MTALTPAERDVLAELLRTGMVSLEAADLLRDIAARAWFQFSVEALEAMRLGIRKETL